MKHLRIATLLASIVQCGCLSPHIIRHELPRLRNPAEPFARLGCLPSDREPLALDCRAVSGRERLGCDRLLVDPLLGGLTPAEPIAACLLFEVGAGDPTEPYIYDSKTPLLSVFTRFLALTKIGPVLLTSKEELRLRFAPIDSPTEALSFAIASTGLLPLTNVKLPRGYRYVADRIEETHVEATAEGYVVKTLQHDVPVCWVGRLDTTDLLVTRDGFVRPLATATLYELKDPTRRCDI